MQYMQKLHILRQTLNPPFVFILEYENVYVACYSDYLWRLVD